MGKSDKKGEKINFELSVLYELANAISYTLDQERLIKLIMESIFKIVSYDICGALLFDANTADIFLKPAYPKGTALADEIKDRLITSVSTITGENIRAKKTSVAYFSPVEGGDRPLNDDNAMQSIFNVPFVLQGKVAGMLAVGSCKVRAFGEDDVKIFYTIVNQASTSLERLRSVVKAERSKMHSMVESMAEGVIMMDVRQEIVVFNPRARELLGFGLKEEVPGAVLKERLKTARLDGTLEKCWAEGEPVAKEAIIPHGEENMILHSDTLLVKDDRQKPIGTVMILRDVTREREIDKMKTEFISIVSHELRTPLSILKAGLALVKDQAAGPINATQERFLGMADSNIDRLTDIINNLLNISKIEAGKLEVKKQLVSLGGLIRAVVFPFGLKAKEKNLELKVNFPDGDIAVYADAEMMTQVFINLIDNALKFTEHGHVEISAREREDVIECTIEDTGRGISHYDLPKIFGKFQQFDRPAGGSGEKGTGLGLAISKGFIELHKGKIWVESEIDKGAKFIFTLPRYTPEEIFNECLNNEMRQAERSGSALSLIVVSLPELEQRRDVVLKGMQAVLKDSLRRKADLVTLNSGGELVVLLVDCNKENALRVKERLGHVLAEYLEKENLTAKIELRLSSATYPDEARDSEELIEKARGSS